MKKSINILGVDISPVNPEIACNAIEDWIERRHKTYVCIAPVSTIMDCQKDKHYLDIVNGAGMTTPDGMPLVWLGKLFGNKDIKRTYGPDLMLTVCGISEQKGYSHYFYGGDEQSNTLLIEELKKRFPNLKIAGSFAPEYKKVGEKENSDIIFAINKSDPDILWVGLGSPKQDYWMYNHRNELNVPVMVGVGAAFDFIAGTKLQAPKWMRRSGLEWFFRLMCEPKRLWKRYLIGNTMFIWLLLCSGFKKTFSKKI